MATAKKKVISRKKTVAAKKNPAKIRPNPAKQDRFELIDVGEWDRHPTNAASLDEFLSSTVGKRFLGVLAWHSVIAPRECVHSSPMMCIEAQALMNSFRDGASMALKTIQHMRSRRNIVVDEQLPPGEEPPVEWGDEPLSSGNFQ